MTDQDRVVWISFDTEPDTGIVTSMTYVVGQGRPRTWKKDMPWPRLLTVPLKSKWPVMASLPDQEIYECVMRVDYAWPAVNQWIRIQDSERATLDA